MPFEVFRRHQRKVIGVLAITAMFAFVVADSVPRLLQGNMPQGGGDSVVAELYGRPVYRSEVEEMRAQRNRANIFLDQLFRFNGIQLFGDLSTRSMVDAVILQHEADALKMPATPEMATAWLNQQTNGLLDAARFDQIYRDAFRGSQVTDVQLLTDIANQIRLFQVRNLPGPPPVTPLDVFRAYQDQNERVSVHAVPFKVEDYLSKVPEPSTSEIEAFYGEHKDSLPDPKTGAPGFKLPRRVKVEYVSVDGRDLDAKYRAEITAAELQEAYERRKEAEFKLPPLAKLPADLFSDDPKATLTPPVKGLDDQEDPDRYETFADRKANLIDDLVHEKIQAAIEAKFDPIREGVMQPYSEARYEYYDAEGEEGAGPKAKNPPEPPNLKAAAEKDGLGYEATPLLTREEAGNYGQIAKGRVGLSRDSRGKAFADEVFESKAPLYDPLDFVDEDGRRYLAWRTEDLPSRTPPLSEIRAEVARAWKVAKARPLAKQDADALAEQARKKDGDLRAAAGEHPLITTKLASRMQPGPILTQFRFGAPRPSEISEMPNAGDALREAMFDLRPKGVAVAPDQPREVYYVLAPDQRVRAKFEALYAPYGPRYQFQDEARQEANTQRAEAWMELLRAKAGLNPDWKPADEADRSASETAE
jgi:hypothetical protein